MPPFQRSQMSEAMSASSPSPHGPAPTHYDSASAGAAPALAESLEMARVLATEAKRKAQRLLGAQAAVQTRASIEGRAAPHTTADAKREVDRAQAQLAGLLERWDGGDALKRARRDVAEAEGMSDFVRATPAVRLYREAIDGEEAAARLVLDDVARSKAELSEAKDRLSFCQGVLYALLEAEEAGGADAVRGATALNTKSRVTGGGLGNAYTAATEAQLRGWAAEVEEARRVEAEQRPHLLRRRQAEMAFHTQQGYRRATERFGTLSSFGPGELRGLHLEILTHDAQNLRVVSKAKLKALEKTHSDREASAWEANCTEGAIAFLTDLEELPAVRSNDSASLLLFLTTQVLHK